jgi:hypothetical protein
VAIILVHNHPSGTLRPSQAEGILPQRSGRRANCSTSNCSTTSSLPKHAITVLLTRASYEAFYFVRWHLRCLWGIKSIIGGSIFNRVLPVF